MTYRPVSYTKPMVSVAEKARSGYDSGMANRDTIDQALREIEESERKKVLQGRNDILWNQQQEDGQTARYRGGVEWDQKQEDRQRGLDEVERQKGLMKAYQDDLANLEKYPTLENYLKMIRDHPKYLAPIKEAFNLLSAEEKEVRLRDVGQLYAAIDGGHIEIADQMMVSRMDALAAEEGEDKQKEINALKAMRMRLKSNPEAVKASIGINLAMTDDEDTLKWLLDSGGTGTYTTPQQGTDENGDPIFFSTNKEGTIKTLDGIKPLNPNKVITTKTEVITIDGRTGDEISRRPINNEQAAHDAKAGELNAVIEKGGAAKQAEAVGAQAVKLSGEMASSYGKATKNIAHLKSAFELLEGGAWTGPVDSLFPSWDATTIALENIQKKLGLDVIGDVTFGALSKGELDLALSTALPLNMDQPELKSWIKKAIDAKEKYAEHLQSAAVFLSTPGNTLNGWLKQNGIEAQQEDDWMQQYMTGD